VQVCRRTLTGFPTPLLQIFYMPSIDQGASPDRYMIIPRTLVFLTREDDVLLIKGAPNKKLWANRYNGIGGHIKVGEDVLSAARREIQEETGLVPEDLWLCGTITIDTGGNPGIGIFLFRGECPTGIPQPSPEGLLSWLPVGELGNYPLVEDLILLLPKVLALKKGDPPISVRYTYNQDDQLEIYFGK
jgi:8-oxo-dGTP diphosphatase